MARIVDGNAHSTFDRRRILNAAARMLARGGDPPELIVLVQSRPGEFSAAEIDDLRRLAPLARVRRLLGTWCEGEARRRPAAERLHEHLLAPMAGTVGLASEPAGIMDSLSPGRPR